MARALSAAIEAPLAQGTRQPPEGVTHADWDRVQAARQPEEDLGPAELRQLGPQVAPGQLMLALDEVLTPAVEPRAFHELRTACLLTADGRRYLSGRGAAFLRQVQAAVQACTEHSVLVLADGARWIHTFVEEHQATWPATKTVFDWYHGTTSHGRAGK